MTVVCEVQKSWRALADRCAAAADQPVITGRGLLPSTMKGENGRDALEAAVEAWMEQLLKKVRNCLYGGLPGPRDQKHLVWADKCMWNAVGLQRFLDAGFLSCDVPSASKAAKTFLGVKVRLSSLPPCEMRALGSDRPRPRRPATTLPTSSWVR